MRTYRKYHPLYTEEIRRDGERCVSGTSVWRNPNLGSKRWITDLLTYSNGVGNHKVGKIDILPLKLSCVGYPNSFPTLLN